MIRVGYPAVRYITQANIWRVLDLSGLTRSVRESRNVLRSGWVFLNNNQVLSKKARVSLGVPFTLEIRFPNGRIRGEEIILFPIDSILKKPRSNEPFKTFRKG